jgi:eukaryotic-like serine/threonine-protein kinase
MNLKTRHFYSFGPFRLDSRECLLNLDGKPVPLAPKTFEALLMLVENAGQLVDKDDLMRRLWPSTFVEEANVAKHVSLLRNILSEATNGREYIETIPKRGYRLVVEVLEVDEAEAGSQIRTIPGASMSGKKVSHYRVLQVLGGGGMGVVYTAEDLKLGRRVALKFLPEEIARNAKVLERFEREARAASTLDHPNICAIHEFGEHEGQPFIVMPLLAGQNLRDQIAARATPFTTDELLDLTTQIGEGLAAAHEKGIVHRDIKPANIFITNRSEAKILDFGLAKLTYAGDLETDEEARSQETTSVAANDVSLSLTGVALGTAPYMSPEQVRGEELDARSDLFSFGLVIYEMATRKRAFWGDTAAALQETILNRTPVPARDLNPELPHQLAEIIDKALEKDREARYQTAAEMCADLKRLKRDKEYSRRVFPSNNVAGTADAAVHAAGGSAPLAVVEEHKWGLAAGLTIAGLLLVALLMFRWLSPLPPPRVVRTSQLTRFAHATGLGGIASDGARIFFLARDGIRLNLMQVPMSGGEALPFPSPFHSAIIMDVSPDRSELLVASFNERSGPFEYWTLPVVGGSPRRLSNLTGFGVFSPDGRQIAYPNTDGIYVCSRGGSDAHKLVSLTSTSWALAWSPDGKGLRFTLENPGIDTDTFSLWEVSADGSNLHPVFPGWHEPGRECCGRWSADGRYYVFLSTQGDGQGAEFSVWARREKGTFPWSKPAAPVRLTAGPIGFGSLAAIKDGQPLLTIGGARDQIELLRSTPDRKQFSPMVNLGEVFGATLTPKGDWLALVLPGVHSWTLWRSRPDGTERTQLASDFAGTLDMPRWSPDGTKVVFQGIREGRPWNIFVVPAGGGASQELLPNDQVHEFPDWLADGESVVYSTPPASPSAPREDSGIFVLDLKTRKTTRVPGSEGLRNPRTAFGGRYVAALSADQKKVMLFDFQTRNWKEIASNGKNFYHMESSRDGKYLYYQDTLEEGQPLYRVHTGDWKRERVMSFESLLQTGVLRCRFMGLTLDGSPMLLATRGGGDVYALDLDLP